MVTSSSNQTGNLAQFLGKLKLFESLNLELLYVKMLYIHFLRVLIY